MTKKVHETQDRVQTDCTADRIPDKDTQEGRRDALKKIGAFSAYTAPALLAVLTPRTGKAVGS